MLIKFLDGTKRDITHLPGADLCYADLRGAELICANLRRADLRGAELRDADLRGADLRCANLHGANLHGASLHGADLCYANLCGANLTDAKGLAQFQVCPEVGAFIGFKKVGVAIITLLIPADAKRVNAYGSRKCRAEFAYVQKVEGELHKLAYRGFKYPKSGLVTPDKYDPDPRSECSHGIHFFITRQEAVEYC